jgi:hypothetical protein
MWLMGRERCLDVRTWTKKGRVSDGKGKGPSSDAGRRRSDGVDVD